MELMAASVELIVRKFIDGNNNYRKSLHEHLIDTHPNRDAIVELIEQAGIKYSDTDPASSLVSRVHRIQREIDERGLQT
jgi:hypothetical protein